MNDERANWEALIQREDFMRGVKEEFAARLRERSLDPMKRHGLDFGDESGTPTLGQLFARLYGRLILADILPDRACRPNWSPRSARSPLPKSRPWSGAKRPRTRRLAEHAP